ncbi:MAG: ribonuclease E/G [Planctomycetota bacterium]|nr:ribonuclease E/G [Planctomycetota bacterium]
MRSGESTPDDAPASSDDGGERESDASDASAGGDDEGGSSRRKRRSRRGSRSRRKTRSKAESAPDDAADAPSDGEGAEDDASDDPRERRRRRRRKRRAARGGDEAEAPAAADESSSEDEGDAEPSRRKRRRRRRKDKAKSKDKASESSRKDGGKSGRRRKDERGRSGRRESGRDRRRSRDGRRDRRLRDPRAIDIVPKLDFGTADEPLEKILLVNASDREEARIALLVNGRLEEIYIEALKERSAAGNIYRGRIQNVEIGIGAAFVDLGRGVTGFLHASDMPLKEDEEPGAKVTDRLHPGDEVIVQITRDGIGRKGPALTGRISLPGRYLVLMPFTSRSGISRRIPRGPERERMRKLVRKLEVPDGMGVIVRTASETTDLAALDADLQHLVSEWERIRLRAAEPGQPGVLRGESDIAERSVRDIMPSDVTRIVVDKEQTAGRIHQLLRIWYPSEAAAAAEAGHLSIRMAAAEAETPVGELRAGDDAPTDAEAAEPMAEEEPGEVEPVEAEAADAPEDEEAAADASETADADEGPSEEAVDDADDADDADDVEAADALDDVDDEEVDEDEDEDDADDEDDDDAEEEDRAAREARLEEQRRLAKIIPEVLLHTDVMPLFHTYDVETQLEDAFRRALRLPSGGSIVIDPTEALVAVDVNSGRLTDESDPETTALKTNLEAVGEVARQLRLRDLGGLVVLDFIDMRERKSRREVQKALHEALSRDRARIRVGRMGPFGCVIMSRQRIRQALSRVTHEDCDTCGGTGRRRVSSGLGLRVLREMEARVARSRGRGGLEVRAPQPVVDWIHKHRGSLLSRIKKACSGPVSLSADSRLAVDGWAMKGTPPSRKDGGEEAS